MRSDVTIPGNTTPVSALVKVTPEAELPIWGSPRLDPEFVTEFYSTDRRRRTDSYMCFVGVIDDAAADRERPEGRTVRRAQLDGERATLTQ